MFSKLAFGNVRRSLRDYGVYLLTLTFGVCLFYTFNSVDNQGAILYLSQTQNQNAARLILTLIDLFSLFVAVVLACLILYADGFLMRRRKRELGLYLLLGLSQGQVSRLLCLETGLVGLVSLILGLGLGSAASQGLSALTLSMFSMELPAFHLSFSPRAALRTVVYFLLIFLLVMLFRGLQVSRAKLLDLMQGNRKNEELRPRPLGVAVLQLGLGILCLACAYTMLLVFGLFIVVLPIWCVPMLTLGTVGTLLIFRSLSGFVLRLAQRHPKLYFRNLNLFTLRQWISKVHTTYLSQTIICLLLLLAIGVTASSMGLNTTLEAMTDEGAPFDLTIQNYSGDTRPLDFDRLFREGGVDSTRLTHCLDIPIYYNDPAVTGFDPPAALRLSDYDALLRHSGCPAYTGPLPTDQLPWDPSQLVTGGLGLTVVVIPDDMAQSLDLRRQLWCGDYTQAPEETERMLLQPLLPLKETYSLGINSRLQFYQDMMGSKILALFLGLYLGLTFLLAAAAVLALQQLSQAADNTGRYAILRRLGAGERMVSRSATQQVALAFLLPLLLAVIHSLVGMKAANDVIASVGRVDTLHSTLVTGGLLLVVYGGYFLATALVCRRMARRG